MKTRCLALLPFVAAALLTPLSLAQAPVFEIAPVSSQVVFNVKSSVSIVGKFDKWDSTLKFTSTDINTGVLDIKIDAASVDTGSGMKNDKLRSKDFFDVAHDPYITFHSTKIIQTGPAVKGQPVNFEIDGDFTITVRELVPPRPRAPWPLTARTTGSMGAFPSSRSPTASR
jgi:polyisoprenoid-binding protein YceI